MSIPLPGERYLLPSGRLVEVLGISDWSTRHVVNLAYVQDGRVPGPGRGESRRVSMRLDWFLVHATVREPDQSTT